MRNLSSSSQRNEASTDVCATTWLRGASVALSLGPSGSVLGARRLPDGCRGRASPSCWALDRYMNQATSAPGRRGKPAAPPTRAARPVSTSPASRRRWFSGETPCHPGEHDTVGQQRRHQPSTAKSRGGQHQRDADRLRARKQRDSDRMPMRFQPALSSQRSPSRGTTGCRPPRPQHPQVLRCLRRLRAHDRALACGVDGAVPWLIEPILNQPSRYRACVSSQPDGSTRLLAEPRLRRVHARPHETLGRPARQGTAAQA